MFARLIVVLAVALLLWAVFARDSGAGQPIRYHTVAPGETLWSIAVEGYTGDPREGVWRLQQSNRLTGSMIVPGQRLVLP